MKKHRIIFTLCLLSLLLFAGCQGETSATPAQAVTRQLVETVQEGVVIDPTSIEILQTQELENSTYVVVSYQRMWNDHDEQCMMMYETHYQLLRGWQAGSGGGACTARLPAPDQVVNPIHVSGGTQFRQDQNRPDLSHVLGRVTDAQIVKMRVMWEDGMIQDAEVVNGSALAVREGAVQMKVVVGLNEEGEVVYTNER